ncbi:2-oxoisovalerate dehydrogenase [bacterium]|nr:2-oxoisovalerate dehydrogenase [bacterium]
MKKNNNNEIVFLVEEDVESGFTASALGYSIFTQGETFDEIKEMTKDAVRSHFGEDNHFIIRLHFVKDEVVYV